MALAKCIVHFIFVLNKLQALLSTNKYIYIFLFSLSLMYVIKYRANKGVVVVVVILFGDHCVSLS